MSGFDYEGEALKVRGEADYDGASAAQIEAYGRAAAAAALREAADEFSQGGHTRMIHAAFAIGMLRARADAIERPGGDGPGARV